MRSQYFFSFILLKQNERCEIREKKNIFPLAIWEFIKFTQMWMNYETKLNGPLFPMKAKSNELRE